MLQSHPMTISPPLAHSVSYPALHPDSEIIDNLGGPTALARRLGYGSGGPQRVANWRRRGIPALVKLQHAGVFLTVAFVGSAR
jgi:hypothetical protein